jgi:hypothetical protein
MGEDILLKSKEKYSVLGKYAIFRPFYIEFYISTAILHAQNNGSLLKNVGRSMYKLKKTAEFMTCTLHQLLSA